MTEELQELLLWHLFKHRSEGDEHFRLKLQCVEKLYRKGYYAVCIECSPAGYDGTADVLAIDPRTCRVCVCEIKSNRADFLRDIRAKDRYDKEEHARASVRRRQTEILDAQRKIEDELLSIIREEHLAKYPRAKFENKNFFWQVRTEAEKDSEWIKNNEDYEELRVAIKRYDKRHRYRPSMKFINPRHIAQTSEAYIYTTMGVIKDKKEKEEVPKHWGLMVDDRITKRSPKRRISIAAVNQARDNMFRRYTSIFKNKLVGFSR